MTGPTPSNTISGADSHATTPTSAITSSHISSSRYQTRPQAQTPAQTTTAFIFHVSTLIYRPRNAGSPPNVGTNRANSNSNATWSPIPSVSDSNSSSISGYTSCEAHSDSTWNQNINININPTNSQSQSQSRHHHPDPLRQHQIKLLRPLLPRPSAGETIAGLQAVGIPFVIVWEPTESSGSKAGQEPGLKCGNGDDDRLNDEFTSEEEVANTVTRVLGLEVPIGSERVVGRWTLLRSVAAPQKGGKCGKDGKEVTGTLVIGDDEEKNREMAKMLGLQAERVVNSEEVEMMWKRKKEVAEEEKGDVEVGGKKLVKKEDRKEEQKNHDLNPQQNQSQRQHLKPSKPTLTLRSRLSCPFDDMKIVEGLCSSPEDKVDEETTDDDSDGSEKQAGLEEEKGEANKGRPTESPTPTTPSTPDTVQGLYIPVKHGERTVAYVPVSPTSTTYSEKGLESPVTRITSIIFFSPPSPKTWDRDVRVVSKLCQSQGDGEEAPKLYIVQKPEEVGRSSPSLGTSYSSSISSSTSSNIPSPTFSTAPSEASLETLATTTSTVFSRASTTSTTESAPSKRQFKLTMPRTASDWIREVTTQWRATCPNLPDKAQLPYYLIDPLTCALQVLEIGRQRAQSTIWARANLPVHLRQVLRLETLYIVDSGERPSHFFNDLGASGNKNKHSASSDPDPDMSFQRYLASLGVDVIPAKRCRRIGMSNVHALEKRVQMMGYVCRPVCDSFTRLEPLQDEDENEDQKTKKVHDHKDSGDASAQQPTTQTHHRRTSWFRQLITRGQPRSKPRNPGAGDQSQTQRPSTSTSTNKTRNKHTHHSNNSTTNLTITSTKIPTFPPTSTGIPQSMTTPNYTNYPNTTYTPNTNPSTTSKATATAKFYSPNALDMVLRSPTQKVRDINAITAFCHSNNIETAVQYAINREYWECVDKGLSPVWPTSGGGESTRIGRI
ncbi:hypothetical protein QR685DRAFT_349847 [Neurospora intermedia]|uniref:ERCC4 domain-containing protein n=1 Tax=Neurospora intermedia TaxID=5142 RepID=A0ABR3D5F1_NEUIN